MAAILVTYDLNRPGQNYETLIKTLKNLGSEWWHYMESTWVLGGYGLTTSKITEALLPHIDSNDRLLVVDITSDSWSGWLPREASDWLNKWA